MLCVYVCWLLHSLEKNIMLSVWVTATYMQARSCQFMGLELGQKDGPFIYDNAQEWCRTWRRSYEATKRAAAAEEKSTDSSSHAPVFLGHIYDFLLDQEYTSYSL